MSIRIKSLKNSLKNVHYAQNYEKIFYHLNDPLKSKEKYFFKFYAFPVGGFIQNSPM